jgi:hypothetical protein
MRKQTSRTNTYTTLTKITLDQLSNSLAVKNAGNSICLLNNDPLQPGEVKIFTAWPEEILTGKYNFYFQTPAVVPIGYVQDDMAVVTEQYYLPH